MVEEPSRLTLEREVRDLEEIRRNLGLERLSLMGWSYLGSVTALYAAAHPHPPAAPYRTYALTRRYKVARSGCEESPKESRSRAREPDRGHETQRPTPQQSHRVLPHTVRPIYPARWVIQRPSTGSRATLASIPTSGPTTSLERSRLSPPPWPSMTSGLP